MKIALATTTIHVPHALKLMRKASPSMFNGVKFFVTGDEKSPHLEIERLCDEVDSGKTWNVELQCYMHSGDYMRQQYGTAEYYDVERQKSLGYKCSDVIGWSTLSRRNIAFLEAVKWGADVIYSWDNDNTIVFKTPDMGFEIFGPYGVITQMHTSTFDGIKIGGYTWFDPGTLLIPATRHRGFPHNEKQKRHTTSVTDARIGVAAGLVIGDPDIDAVTRMEHRPDIGAVHILGQTGVVVDPHTWTVFNSQNTAVIRELVPAWFMMPGVGRHDDIYASLIVQRVARERDLHVHFGPPFTYQQRNEHNLITDLRAEIDGMENVSKLADLLDSIILPGKSVIADTRIIYEVLGSCPFIPEQAVKAALYYLDDCEGVL